jgi:hypothetical protein
MNEIEKYLTEWNTSVKTEADKKAFSQKIKAEQALRTAEEKAEISRQAEQAFDKFVQETEEFIETIKLRDKLEPILPYISLSTIAKEYFGKSRNWLYQKLNNNVVNGKPAQFNENEIKILRKAVDDITKKLQTVSTSLSC